MEKTAKVYTKEHAFALKGVAILFMMFHHSFRDEKLFQGFQVDFSPFAVSDVVVFSVVCKLCVAVFCFISGYGLYLTLCKGKIDGKASNIWIYNRLVNLLTSYWYVFIVSFLLILFLDKGEIWESFFTNGRAYGMFVILLDMLGLGHFFDTPLLNGAWWYMSAAIFFIIIAPAMAEFLKKFGSVTVVGIIVFLPRIFNESLNGGNNIFKYLLIFMTGMIFAKDNYMNHIINFLPFPNKRWLSKLYKLLAECFIFLILYKLGNILDSDVYWEIKYTFIPLIVILFSIEFIADIPYLKKFLVFLGIYSMDIFLLHNFCRNYFPHLMYQDKHFLVAPIVMLGFGVAAALIMHFLKRILGCDKLKELLSYKGKADI